MTIYSICLDSTEECLNEHRRWPIGYNYFNDGDYLARYDGHNYGNHILIEDLPEDIKSYLTLKGVFIQDITIEDMSPYLRGRIKMDMQ